MTPIVWIWNIGTRLPAISEFATMTRARQTEISVSPVIFESFVTRLTRGKSCHFDGWNNILRDILSRILSSFCRVKILPFFFFFYLSFVIHVDRWFVSLFPIFQRIAFPCRRFYQNARETGWFIHLKAVLIEKNFAFGLYSD